jgi:hypothetical protein
MINFDQITVIDDFLPEEQFRQISSLVMNTSENKFPFFIQKDVADHDETTGPWSWYATHTFFIEDEVHCVHFPLIKELFLNKFRNELNIMSGLIRVRANFYPWTSEVKSHDWHEDYPNLKNNAALFSLNTCDGHTSFKNAGNIDSVANRMIFFNAHQEHCSSTTSNSYGRYNINFNFL